MSVSSRNNDNILLKTQAAHKALDYVRNNMRVGLGTGSTANIFIDLLAEKVKSQNLDISCVATSQETQQRALKNGLKLFVDSEIGHLDIAIDGTDEFDSNFRLIKGGGGALLREKIIAQAADKFIIIADQSKSVEVLGDFPLPIECINYEMKMLFTHLERAYNKYADSTAAPFIPECRKNKNDSNNFLTSLGHYIVDLQFKKIRDPEGLAQDLSFIPGVVDHGLFLNEANVILTNIDEYHKQDAGIFDKIAD